MVRDLTHESTVNVNQYREYRRTGSTKIGMNGNSRTSMDESTPLLDPTIHEETGRGPVWRFFLDAKGTPGTDSPNLFVKCPAYLWNVGKVTLLSCTYIECAGPSIELTSVVLLIAKTC